MHAESVKPLQGDIFRYNPGKLFDRILLDAPCSALGVIRRNPDVKYRHNDERIMELGKRQLHMLLHVSSFLKKEGVLVYSVCSNEPEETENVAKEFLNIRREFDIIDTTDDILLPHSFRKKLRGLVNNDGILHTYPQTHDMDGFFAVRFTRK